MVNSNSKFNLIGNFIWVWNILIITIIYIGKIKNFKSKFRISNRPLSHTVLFPRINSNWQIQCNLQNWIKNFVQKKKFEEKLEKTTIMKNNLFFITNFYKHLRFIDNFNKKLRIN